MKLKPFLIELLILFTSILLFIWLTCLFNASAFDLDLNDTYVVFKGITSFPVILLVFLVYIVKEAFYRYKRKPQNIILLTSIFLTGIELTMLIRSLAGVSKTISQVSRGWTVYPPLSALPSHPAHLSPPSVDPFGHATQILVYTQIFFLALLVILAIVTGKNWNSNKNVS